MYGRSLHGGKAAERQIVEMLETEDSRLLVRDAAFFAHLVCDVSKYRSAVIFMVKQFNNVSHQKV